MLKDSQAFYCSFAPLPSVTHKSTIFKRQLFITLCGISVVKTSYKRYTFNFFYLFNVCLYIPIRFLQQQHFRKRTKQYKTHRRQCKMSSSWPVKGLCGKCLSVWGLEPHTPTPSLHTVQYSIRIYSILIHTGKGGGIWTRERSLEGQHTDFLSSL
jgi:hypothetical protein